MHVPQKLNQSKSEKQLVFPTNKSNNLKTFLENQKLEICLSESEILFVECYLLTLVKKRTGDLNHPDKTDESYVEILAPIVGNIS